MADLLFNTFDDHNTYNMEDNKVIHVDWNSKRGRCEALISCHCDQELKTNFKALLGAICEDPDVTMIFLEEFNIKAKELEKQLEELKKW